MKAVILRETGGPEKLRLEDVGDPVPGPAEVVVRIGAAALNHRDVWIRTGRYAGIKLPIILGSDGAGKIEAVGPGVDGVLVGKTVIINPSLNWGSDQRVQGSDWRILGLPDDGTYAQRVKVPASNVVLKPPALTLQEAAAVPLAGLTAYRAVVTRAEVQPGEAVLVTGIGGGVALFALQIARVLGARVFVTSGSDEKIERAKALGAEGGVNYHDKDWVKKIQQLCGGVGPDVGIDSAGGDSFAGLLEAVRPGGRLVTYGATVGAAHEVQVRRIFWKQLTVLGSTMGTADEFERVVAVFGDGKSKPVIDSVFSLEEAPAAHARMEGGEQFGKIILTVD